MFTVKESVLKWGAALGVLAVSAMFWACSDDKSVAGGSTEDAGIIANLNVAGLTQKGPFVKGSEVTVQGINCKTLELTDEVFEGKVKSDKGDFAIDGVSLKSTCALFEVTGKYRNEITGKKSSEELTLHALTNLKDRKNVNINLLTELEYERLMYLVTEKGKKFADAKERAEKEVLAAFGIDGDFDNSEDLTIFESGDGNAALLAVSVLMQAETDDADLAKRIEKFADSFAETGEWKDDKTKSVIEEWQVAATADGTLDSIRKNVESWGYADVVPAFEKYIEVFGDTIILSSDSESSSSVTPKSSDSETSVSSSSLKPDEPAEGSFTDSRDGKTYKTVKIGDQVWMAENLNFETDSSYCYNDSAEYCAEYGRLYEWGAAMDACPSGWHLPDTAEWRVLLAAVGGDSVAGMKLKSTSGWNSDGNGTDDFGFTVLPAGGWDNKMFEGEAAGFWSSVGYGNYAAAIRLLADAFAVRLISGRTYVGHSVRCVKGSEYDATANTLKDLRDGKVYKTVKIGDQVWMAENLNYSDSTKTASLKDKSWCYDNESDNCVKYGRLYTWAAAIDSVALANDAKAPLDCGYGKSCTLPAKVQGVCPDGWHLPNYDEWVAMLTSVGWQSNENKVLKSQSGWSGNGNGSDSSGFSALPAGYYNGSFNHAGDEADFWSSFDHYSDYAYKMTLDNNMKCDRGCINDERKNVGNSVRCVKDGIAVPASSSSEVSSPSSSSVALVAPCKTETEDNCEYGTLTDSRDGQTYKTVTIGTQTWMAENLNYAYTDVPYSYAAYESDSTSWCFDNALDNCAMYGRLYTWSVAMDSVGVWSTKGKGCGYDKTCNVDSAGSVRGICPEGWHLPTQTEWGTLFAAVGGMSTAGKMLKSTSGWTSNGNGTDGYSFAALPADSRTAGGDYRNKGYFTNFWSSSEKDRGTVYTMSLTYYVENADLTYRYKPEGLSVRCVKD
ncbi:fibrobacter succinogenes major paralogous domain-containing protein [Fibrobacter succinogenes]|uniref:fibrobacter succinogenes major paralogous domain-containing protein n=1 Tax=Fibrobacter succinogenes TaxID=833 RepID=UPI0026ED7E62|nr:fibrobacter succinogenes major paralogous domain-containing protein [Fibrobacter succinogenes]